MKTKNVKRKIRRIVIWLADPLIWIYCFIVVGIDALKEGES